MKKLKYEALWVLYRVVIATAIKIQDLAAYLACKLAIYPLGSKRGQFVFRTYMQVSRLASTSWNWSMALYDYRQMYGKGLY